MRGQIVVTTATAVTPISAMLTSQRKIQFTALPYLLVILSSGKGGGHFLLIFNGLVAKKSFKEL